MDYQDQPNGIEHSATVHVADLSSPLFTFLSLDTSHSPATITTPMFIIERIVNTTDSSINTADVKYHLEPPVRMMILNGARPDVKVTYREGRQQKTLGVLNAPAVLQNVGAPVYKWRDDKGKCVDKQPSDVMDMLIESVELPGRVPVPVGDQEFLGANAITVCYWLRVGGELLKARDGSPLPSAAQMKAIISIWGYPQNLPNLKEYEGLVPPPRSLTMHSG
eukprot:TRINITY_DN3382_c0_g2_i3.p1 TRINITY_DN3382_c0_g2~~TRINITY_DN3382_c0_g2_i3.p1  ORF type:complete len:221 (-),score=31.68 TRINITY_DN3382_c0_g2_i3:173-835(-)